MTCCDKREKKTSVSRDIAIIAVLSVVLLPIAIYFVQKKVENDTAISRDTRRIADSLESRLK